MKKISIKKLQEKKMKTLGDKKECIAVFGNQFLVYPEKDVQEFIKEILDEIKKEIKRLDMEASKHCFKKGKMCDECSNKKQPLMKIIKIIKQKAGELK